MINKLDYGTRPLPRKTGSRMVGKQWIRAHVEVGPRAGVIGNKLPRAGWRANEVIRGLPARRGRPHQGRLSEEGARYKNPASRFAIFGNGFARMRASSYERHRPRGIPDLSSRNRQRCLFDGGDGRRLFPQGAASPEDGRRE